MSKIRPDPSRPLTRAQARVYKDDYDFVCHVLGGGVSGLQNEIYRELFDRFSRYLKTLNLSPYATNHDTLQHLRRVLSRTVVTELDSNGFGGH